MPSAVMLSAITNSWLNTVFEMVNGIVTTPLTWIGWRSTPIRLLCGAGDILTLVNPAWSHMCPLSRETPQPAVIQTLQISIPASNSS